MRPSETSWPQFIRLGPLVFDPFPTLGKVPFAPRGASSPDMAEGSARRVHEARWMPWG